MAGKRSSISWVSCHHTHDHTYLVAMTRMFAFGVRRKRVRTKYYTTSVAGVMRLLRAIRNLPDQAIENTVLSIGGWGIRLAVDGKHVFGWRTQGA